jgi:hypothetical protein
VIVKILDKKKRMNFNVLALICVAVFSCMDIFAAVVGLSVLRREMGKPAGILGDIHANMRRTEPKSEEEILGGILEKADEKDIATCYLLIESSEVAKRLGTINRPSILADLPGRYRRAPLRKIILEDIEMRGCGADAAMIHADPLFYKQKTCDEAMRSTYVNVLGYDPWTLTYEDVFNNFLRIYLDLSNKRELIASEHAKRVYDDALIHTFKQFEALKQHLCLSLGTTPNREIVGFAYELADKAWRLEDGLCRRPGIEADKAREYEKELVDLLELAFCGLFDLNAYQ